MAVDENPDLSVGIDFRAAVGTRIRAGETMATILGRDADRADKAAERIIAAVDIVDREVPETPLILDRMG